MAASTRRPAKSKQNLVFDQKDKVRLQVNSKTWIYVDPNISEKEVEELKKKYAPKF